MLASGVNFGFRRTVPHFLGVTVGYAVLLLGIGLGLGAVFQAFPLLKPILAVIGGLYILYLAWKIATATGVAGAGPRARPLTFLEALAFQWINPKGVLTAISVISAYAPPDAYVQGLLLIVSIATVITLVVVMLWTGLGLAVRRLLDRPRTLRVFNLVMALALVASLIPVARDLFAPAGV